MRIKVIAGALALALLSASSGWSAGLEKPHHRWRTLWIISGIALTAATSFDAASSAHQREANPLLQNSQGVFSSTRGIALKGGMLTGTLIVQALFERKNPGAAKSFAIANFAAAGALGAVSWHNRVTGSVSGN